MLPGSSGPSSRRGRVVRRAFRALQFPGDQAHPGDPVPPEIGRQPFQQVPGLVLEKDGGPGLALQREHRAFRPLGQPHRLGDARDVRRPAISRQRNTRVASRKPARWSAAAAWPSASSPAGPARPRRAALGLSGGLLRLLVRFIRNWQQ